VRVARARQRPCRQRRQAPAEAGSARWSRRRPGARGWSSLAISVCSAVVLAGTAAAGVQVSPTRIDPGSTARLFFWVANDGRHAIDGVAIGIPADFQLGEAEVKGGWRTSTRARTATWEGRRIAPGQFAFFSLTVKAPEREERALFSVLASSVGGATKTWQVRVDVVRAPPVRDERARLTATIALIVAAVAALLALGGGILALWLWLRPRPEL
jgi:uncharacterized protein YcnI